jgi:acyl dehydratase
MTKRAFEDFAIGEVISLGSRTVTRAEIIAFAAQFDPQPFHLDEAAGGGLFGGLAASGWHGCAIFMRMAVDAFVGNSTCLGSPGVETLKWRLPIRPDDVLSGTTTVLDMRVLRSRPEMGLIRFRHEITNGAGETVLWLEGPILFGRRGAAA